MIRAVYGPTVTVLLSKLVETLVNGKITNGLAKST